MRTEKIHTKSFTLLVISLLCLVALPLAQAGTGNTNENNLWNITSEDFNKIDHNLVWYITENDLISSDPIKIVVDYHHRPTLTEENMLASLGGEVQYVSKYLNSIVTLVTVSDIGKIASENNVARVEFAPDAEYLLSSALPTIGVPTVWSNLGNRGKGVTVAIVDSGIDDEHVGLDDLDDNPLTDDPKVIAFYDAAGHPNQDDGTYEPFDNHGHGTHCSGISTGTGAPNYNHVGVAPQANLVGVRIGDGSIGYNNAMRGVEWVIDNKEKFGIDVMSNSWGLYIGGPSNQNGQSALSRLMDEAVDAGITVFCAAGNTAISMTVYSPADSEKAMAVGSVNDNHVLSIFSSQGPTADGRIKPDICAVGEDVRAPNKNSGTGYVSMSGTSMACPMAAGLGALIIEANRNLNPLEIKQVLHETSEHNTDARFPVSPNNGYGWGVVEAFGAVKRARDLNHTYIHAPDAVHEGDIINFVVNTTYTRTIYTYKGQDGMRLIGDDEILYEVAIPAQWSIPFNISVTSEGPMQYDAFFSVPSFDNGMWILEAEFHYEEDVIEPVEATPKLLFQSMTPTVENDTLYYFFFNYTLNEINGTPEVKNILVDNQDPPQVLIEDPMDGEKISGIVSITGSAYDPDVNDYVETVYIKIEDEDWVVANGTTDWSYNWDTNLFNNGWYNISVVASDGEENSSVFWIYVELDNFNLQPTAVIDSVTPNPANEGDSVSFSGHGMDDDGYIAEFEWKSNIQGFLSSSNTFSTTTLQVGTHEITFRVKDNDGVWSQNSIIFLRINQIPIAFIDSMYPNPANEGELVNFVGHGNDDRSIISYNWRSDIEGFLSDTASYSAVLTPGDHEIYFRVQDDDGEWSQEVMQNLRVNLIPVAYIDSILPNPATEYETVSFTGHGTDDGSIIAYEWTSDIDGLLSEANTFSNGSISIGEHVISFRVKDDDIVWSEFVFQVLKINPVPTAFIDSISPNPANESENVTFTGHGTDVGEIVEYMWHSDVDGWLSDQASFSIDWLSPGPHTIYFAVKNDNDTWSEDVTMDIRINDGPTAYIDSISPSPALYGELVQFTGHGEDDLGILNYSWRSDIDGFLSSDATFSSDKLSTGSHKIYFAVQDTDLLWSSEVTSDLLIHTRPTAVIDSISSYLANEGEEVIFEGHGIDDGVIMVYEWYSSLDDFLSGSPSFSTTTLSIGEHNISFRVRDDEGEWSDYALDSLRINQIPVAQIDSVAPNPANQGDTVSFSGSGSDDRDIISYNWRSSIDGQLSTYAEFDTTQLSFGEHTIYFKVKDDDDVWSQEVSTTLRINQIPTAYIDVFSPNRANEGETITFNGHGADDGNIIAYRWESDIDGLLSTNNNFTKSDFSMGDHTITFSVKDDDNVWSPAVSRILRINQIPVAYIDSVSPAIAQSNNAITFIGHGVDDDPIDEYYWSSSIDGFLSSEEQFMWIGLSNGNHLITFKVKDNDKVWSQEVFFQLTIHEKPTATIDPLVPEFPNANELISFKGEGLDDGIITGYEWISSIDGFLSASAQFQEVLSPGTHVISLRVKDDNDVWSNKAMRIVRVNQIPEAIIESISPNPAEKGNLVFFSGYGEDDGTIAAYKWSSSIDEIIGTESAFAISSLSEGTHQISFSVMDSNGLWSLDAISSLTITPRINSIPTVSLINPDSDEVFTNEVIIQVEAFDEDGEVESIEIKVDDGSWVEISDSGYAYYSLDTSNIGEGEHVIYIRSYDGEDYSTEEFVFIKVKRGEDDGGFFSGDNLFFISLVVVIVLVAVVVLLYILFAGRKRRGPKYIRI